MVFPVAHLTKVTFGELAVMSGPWIFSGRLTVCASSDAVCVVEREISRTFFGSHEIRELPLILEVVQMDIPCRIIKELVFATLMGMQGNKRVKDTQRHSKRGESRHSKRVKFLIRVFRDTDVSWVLACSWVSTCIPRVGRPVALQGQHYQSETLIGVLSFTCKLECPSVFQLCQCFVLHCFNSSEALVAGIWYICLVCEAC